MYEATVDYDYLHFVDVHLVEGASWSQPRAVTGRAADGGDHITTVVDVRGCLEVKRAAMAAHASQIPETDLGVPAEQFAAVYGYEWFVRRGGHGLIEETGLTDWGLGAHRAVRGAVPFDPSASARREGQAVRLGSLLMVERQRSPRGGSQPRAGPPREQRAPRSSMRMFAMAVPGLAPLLSAELAELPGVTVKHTGFDGRSDVVLFEADQPGQAAVLGLALAEDVFVEVGRTLRSEGDNPRWIAGRIWRPNRVERALSVWSELVAPLRASMTFRVIVRVLQERSFLRTELRGQLAQMIGRDRPRWRVADPAQIEVWTSEYQQGRFVTGFRLSDVRMRQHKGRGVERHGALRPTVAAAMVRLAGDPKGVLLDPCCGSGTILAEGVAAGWTVRGSDIDPAAAEVARHNVPEACVQQADVRTFDLEDASIDVCVSNLPFGQQFSIEGDMQAWLSVVLNQLARVTRAGGRVVLLAPDIPRAVVPEELRSRERYRLRLLGTKTKIWVYDRED